MKLTININEEVKDTEIVIHCNSLSPEIEKILATLRILNQQMMVIKENETHILDVAEIIYVGFEPKNHFTNIEQMFYNIYTRGICYE